MQVLDVAAGGGYTSQLLALAVAPNGTLWAQREQPGAALTKRLADRPQANFVPVYRPFEDPVPPDAPKLDLITLVLNYHDITYLPVDRAKMNQRLFAALKPGGRFVVVDFGASGTGITTARRCIASRKRSWSMKSAKPASSLEAEGTFLRNAADPRDVTSDEPKIPTTNSRCGSEAALKSVC